MSITDGRKDAEGHYRTQMIEWFYDLNFEPERILVDTIDVEPPRRGRRKWVVSWDQIMWDANGLPRRAKNGELLRTRRSHSNSYPPPWYREDGNW